MTTDLSTSTAPTLAQGTHLFTHDNQWWILTPDEQFIAIQAPDTAIAEAMATLTRQAPIGSADAQEIVTGLAQLGLVSQRPARAAGAAYLAIHPGGEAIAEALATLLRRGANPCRLRPIDRPTAAHQLLDELTADDLVIACADRAPDQLWIEIDTYCAEHAICWHRIAREGATYLVGPAWQPTAAAEQAPPRHAGYRDTRLRRLATSSWPDQLAASWQSPIGVPALAGAPTLAEPALHAAVAHVAADVAAWANREPAPGVDTLISVTPQLTMTRHPVLPIPDHLLEAAR